MKTKHKLSILSETLLSKETVVCPEQYKQSVVSDKKAFRILVYSWRFINPAVCQGRIVKLESDGQRIVFTKTELYTRVTDISLEMTVTTTTGATTTMRLSVKFFEKLPLNDKTSGWSIATQNLWCSRKHQFVYFFEVNMFLRVCETTK